jgi:hypothetical protein
MLRTPGGLAGLFGEPGDVGDFQIEGRQHIERPLAGGIREVSPSEPWIEE